MKLLVLGGTGGTGRHLVDQGLAAGHDLTVLARQPAKVQAQHARLKVVAGDATDAAAVGPVVAGQDAVLSALGRGFSFDPQRLMERAVPVLVAAMRANGVRRLVFESAFGVGDTIRDLPLFPRLFARTLLRRIYADKLIGDNLIRQSGLDWTLVQPSQLTDGALTRRYRYGESLAFSGMPKISRADTAHFMLDRLNDPASIGKTLMVSY